MDFYPDYSSGSLRLIIFLITGDCVGLPLLIWAFRLLYLQSKSRNRISAFIIILLLSDLIQLIFNLYSMKTLLTNDLCPEIQFWSALHWCGFHLHHLVALEGVLTLKYPLSSARIFSVPCYTVITILVLVFSVLSALTVFVSSYVHFLSSLGTSLFPLSLLVVTCIITCKAPPTAVNKNTHSLFAVAMVTFVMLYFPFMLVSSLNIFIFVHISWYEIPVCLMSLRVISDPLLCVLVCNENLRDVQTPQTHREPNSDVTSV